MIVEHYFKGKEKEKYDSFLDFLRGRNGFA